MYEDERRFDFQGLGLAIKQAREDRGWTQAYLAELVGKTDRTIMNIENKGQHPSFNLFFKLVTLFDISVDQFFYTENYRGKESCRKQVDILLNAMDEKELVVMKATAEGLKKARETEVQ
ncbi:helix-turn-helix transcriptional regulator [Robinsoniella peoriensis]|uniref:helix-turn-helix transcriptional regulator n=1 Tax=Robinsoniella peoriensis TaxID=180332 RepID=UPI00085C12BF|nr:helix-turn-helix transcriptional regulator [Robinsoniella peoriensis]